MTLKEFQKLDRNTPIAQSSKKWRTKNIKDLPLHLFIDCERYLEDYNFIDFCAIFVIKYPWQIIKAKHLYSICNDFGKQKAELFEEYTWAFNPPVFGEVSAPTAGDELREDFVKEFGNWAVLIDRVCKNDITKFKEVEQWTVEDFLFWANYLSGQLILANVK